MVGAGYKIIMEGIMKKTRKTRRRRELSQVDI
jgi:hypothetical protein